MEDLLNYLIASAFTFFILKYIYEYFTDPVFVEFDAYDKAFNEGDLIIMRKDALSIYKNHEETCSNKYLWIIVSFEDGVYTIQNYQFMGMLNSVTNSQITIFKRSQE